MSKFLSLCEGEGGKMYKLSWKLVSFIALDADQQQPLLGRTEQWFVKEQAQRNPGANYRYGILAMLAEYGGGGHFIDFAPEQVAEMWRLIQDLTFSRSKLTWGQEELEKEPRWCRLRVLAREILELAELQLNPPEKPFWFPDVMEIWWNDYRDVQK